ncbi:MAG: sugar phosphate nucleotidyltransferase, partial [Simkaniaceae bacterium]|nr:sugar phosphate nucleotidyltransferase [Candidatus Sacchlamyda saccharinae]
MEAKDVISHQEDDNFLKRVATIVLAGGQGTRLYPLTSTRCKPAVSFGGRYRLIDVPLSNSLNSRINQIFVISQYFASELHQHILSTYQLDMFRTGGLELLTPQETTKGKEWFKGTADAVRQSLDYILRSNAEWFLILSGDQLYNMDLYEMLNFAKQKDADLTIASIPVLEPEAKRMGLLKINAASTITSFHEKPQDPALLKEYELAKPFLKENGKSEETTHYLASMGIYVFKRKALVNLLKMQGDDFGKDLIPAFIEKGKCSSYIYQGYWEDIGTVSSFYKANLILTKGQGLNTYVEENQIFSTPQHIPNALINGTRVTDSLIGQGGIIEADEITHSVVGVRALIKKGTVIRDSVILGNRTYHPFMNQEIPATQYFSIGENCHIEKAIIDEDSKIGNNVQLINKEGLDTYDGDGIFIRDGIIIVTSGAEIPDNFTL